MKGYFSFQKSNRLFSKMGIDQIHEQNNDLIKNIGGATHLINRNDDSSLHVWETSTPELARILVEYKNIRFTLTTSRRCAYISKPLFKYVRKVYNAMSSNPFQHGRPCKDKQRLHHFQFQCHHRSQGITFKRPAATQRLLS